MSNFRAHLQDLKQQAKELSGRSHVPSDVAVLLNDFVSAITEMERQAASADKGADLRVLRARCETLSDDLRKAEYSLKSFKGKVIESLGSDARLIGLEVNKIIGASQAEPDGVIHQAAKEIGIRLRNLIEQIAKS